jgi:hypothetical protein
MYEWRLTPFILSLDISSGERQVSCHFRYHVREITLMPIERETVGVASPSGRFGL